MFRLVTRHQGAKGSPLAAFLVVVLSALCANLARAEPLFSPPQQHFVTDQAGILGKATERTLAAAAQAHEKKTTNEVAIVTVSSLEGWSVERYGLWLASKWGVGKSGKNNGVLILVAPRERTVRIEVGLGLESTLTDAIAKRIIDREIIPHFKRGDMEGGVIAGHQAILDVLEGKKTEPSGPWGVMIMFAFVCFLIWKLDKVYRGGGGGSDGGGGFFRGEFSGGGSFGGGGASGRW